jgi:hypothetical protein
VTWQAALAAAHQALHAPAVVGLLAGLVTAIKADHEAFKQWNSWHDVESFDWNLASFRYARGAALGALTGAGIGSLL